MVKAMLALVAGVLFAGEALAGDGGKIPWEKEPQAAIKAAKVSGKPMMFFFTSDG